MRRIPALLATGALAVTLAACTGSATTTGTTEPVPEATSAEPSPATSPTTAPTPTATAVSGYGAWCDALGTRAEEVAAIFGEEQAIAGPVQTVPPQENSTLLWEESVTCTVGFGDGSFTAPRFTVTEYQYAGQSDADEDFARFGEDEGDPMVVTLEEVQVAGSPAWYVTFVNKRVPPPSASYSVTFQEEDRLVRALFRHTPDDLDTLEPGQAPAGEAERRQQVLDAVELLGG